MTTDVCVCVCARARMRSVTSNSDLLGHSLPSFSTHGIFQARIREQVTISYYRDLPDPAIEPTLSLPLHYLGSPMITSSNKNNH